MKRNWQFLHQLAIILGPGLSVCLSVAYIGPNSRTERHRKTKIGIEVAHITRQREHVLVFV